MSAIDRLRKYQIGFCDGLEYALNTLHLPIEDATEIIKGKLEEIEAELKETEHDN